MEHKKISITLPEDIISDIDNLCEELHISSNSMIELMVKSYLAEKRRIENKSNLKKGYLEMAEINLSIAKECFNSDQATQDAYEHYLMGCE
ncbi:MAG: ribbon-helix-helix protein, CopG family [Clostridia bacterium]|nr:ribbon-helix-helix protein, CopG family [Clostridia bacterium]